MKNYFKTLVAGLALLSLAACTTTSETSSPRTVSSNVVRASWYGFESGTHTASGERWRPYGMTAAHRSLRLGTRVRVTNLQNNQQVIVRINDRGPATWTGNGIDLSKGAFSRIANVNQGIVRVKYEVLASE